MIRSGPDLERLRERFDAVLFDLDGTLLDDAGDLTRRTRAAVRRLVDAGMTVVLCSGRSPHGIVDVHADLGLDTGIVAYNGAWIGPAGGSPEARIELPASRIEDLRTVEEEAAFAFRHGESSMWTVKTRHADHPSVISWYRNVRYADGWHAAPNDGLLRLTMFFEGADAGRTEEAPLHEIAWNRLPSHAHADLRREQFPLSLFPAYRRSTLHLVEVQAASRGKAEAFPWLLRRHGISAARTIAVGDHVNDLPMHEAAGLAVAMGNAVPAVRAAADVLIGANDEEGIARWIEAGAPLPDARVRVARAP